MKTFGTKKPKHRKGVGTSIRVLLALLTFAAPLTQVPHALAAASGPNVAAVFPLFNYSNRDVQHFDVIFDAPVVDATQNMILVDGTAAGCTRVPFSQSGVVFDIQIAGCSDGDVRIGVAPDTVRDESGVLGPSQVTWSDYTHISHAIPNFGIGGWRETGAGAFEFHFLTPTGVMTTNVSAFSVNDPSCVVSQGFYTAWDITYNVTGCPTGVPLTVSFEPYSFFDWYGNAGPATRVQSLPIVLSAALLPPAPVPSPTASVTPTSVASPSASAVAGASPSASPAATSAPATATLAEMLGLGDGPAAPEVLATSTPVVELPEAPNAAQPLTTETVIMPSTQDEPRAQERVTREVVQPNVESPRVQAKEPVFRPINLTQQSGDSSTKMMGSFLLAIGAAALIAICVIYLRGRKPRLGFKLNHA